MHTRAMTTKRTACRECHREITAVEGTNRWEDAQGFEQCSMWRHHTPDIAPRPLTTAESIARRNALVVGPGPRR